MFKWKFNILVGLNQEYMYTPGLGPFEWTFNIEMD